MYTNDNNEDFFSKIIIVFQNFEKMKFIQI